MTQRYVKWYIVHTNGVALRDIAQPSRYATSKLDDWPQHRNISCNAEQFNVQRERLMFCKAIRRNATPNVCTLCHATLPCAISRNATLFVCTLYHSTLRYFAETTKNTNRKWNSDLLGGMTSSSVKNGAKPLIT